MTGALMFLATSLTFIWTTNLCIAMFSHLWLLAVRETGWVRVLFDATVWQHKELWLFVPPGALITAVDHWHHQMWLVFFDMLTLYNWWNFRSWPDDDNRWDARVRGYIRSTGSWRPSAEAVEWLMGFPTSWSRSVSLRWETPSSPRSESSSAG